MKAAVCKNSIASIVLIKDSPVPFVEEVHMPGEKKNWFRKYKETIVRYKGYNMTLKEISRILSASVYVSEDKELWFCPQVSIHKQEYPWQGVLTNKVFVSDDEALKYFNQVVEENNMQEIEQKD